MTSEAPSERARIQRAVDHLRRRVGRAFRPKLGVVLGSGLGGALASALAVEHEVPYGEIPGFLPSTVQGHAGRLLFGRLDGAPVVVMQGRVHLYEGHPAADVVLPVRVLAALGAPRVLLTNAAGGVSPTLVAGDLMLIRDHLNLTGRNPLVGPNEAELGPRFPDMTAAYSPSLRAMMLEAAEAAGVTLRVGVYAGLLGPTYETPAEIKMLQVLGADAVGMSTVLETIALRHMGCEVVAISCISNQGAGISPHPLSHAEVEVAAKQVAAALAAVVRGFVARLPGAARATAPKATAAKAPAKKRARARS